MIIETFGALSSSGGKVEVELVLPVCPAEFISFGNVGNLSDLTNAFIGVHAGTKL